MPYFMLAKVLLVLIFIAYAGYVGYGMGQDSEKAVWLETSITLEQQAQKAKALALAEKQREADEQYNGLIEVINEQAKLNRDLESFRDNHERLYVDARQNSDGSCPLPGQTEDSGQYSGTPHRVELGEAFADEIRRDYLDAQRVTNQYLICRQELMKLADIIYMEEK